MSDTPQPVFGFEQNPLDPSKRISPYRVLVMGVGGGGCNAVGRMAIGWTEGPERVAIDTDAQALAACSVPQQVRIGSTLTQAFGAGGDIAIGKLAAEDDLNILRELVSGTDVIFMVATLGGGTGSGAAPILAQVAKEAQALLVCFATMPFDFEGERKKKQAEESMRALRQYADAVISIPNQRLFTLLEDQTSLSSAFQKADEILGVAIRAIWKMLMQTGLINLNFSDLRNLLESSNGTCAFGYGEATGSDRADRAVGAVFRDPLLDEGRLIEHSNSVMINIIGGPDLTLIEVQKIMKRFNERCMPDVRYFMGATVDDDWSGRLAITVLASGHRAEAILPPITHAEAVEEPTEMVAITPEEHPASSQKATRKKKEIQPDLKFDPVDKGRFKNVDPTIYDGEDLDIPTFMRRGIKLSFDR